jgi:hypothetical protein
MSCLWLQSGKHCKRLISDTSVLNGTPEQLQNAVPIDVISMAKFLLKVLK